MAYDSWGKRRTLNGAPVNGTPTPDNLDGVTDNKGYTGHEMLDQLDLVHMNGRIYDPLVARMMSADPYIQDPLSSQSYNRYTYVWNNPTNLTDPTGFVAQDAATKCWWTAGCEFYDYSGGKKDKVISDNGDSGECAAGANNTLDKGNFKPSDKIASSDDVDNTGGAGAANSGLLSRIGSWFSEAWSNTKERVNSVFTGQLPATAAEKAAWVAGLREAEAQGKGDEYVRRNPLPGFNLAANLMMGPAGGVRGAVSNAVKTKLVINAGADVTPAMIRAALAGDTTKSMQAAISLPAVQRYVDRLLAGEVAPAIKMDGQIIVDGNHRYVAGKLLGQTPEVAAGTAPASRAAAAKPISEIKIDPTDWGNH